LNVVTHPLRESYSENCVRYTTYVNMVSAKGKPTDPKLKEQVTEGMNVLISIN